MPSRLFLATVLAFAALPNGLAAAVTDTYTFTSPGEHRIVLPPGVTSLHVVADGARGGTGDYFVTGGYGARVEGDLTVTHRQQLFLLVGGRGTHGNGWGGAGGGGGASDVRTLSASAGLTPTDARLLVAGGGGGSGRGYSGYDTAGSGGNGAMPGGDSRSTCNGCGPKSGGGSAGVPAGNGEGGHSGAAAGSPEGEAGWPGVRGAGGGGAFLDRPAPGGYNGGGVGGGSSTNGASRAGGGGGGGGYHGGGGGGGGTFEGNESNQAWGGGGGGGGSNLLPSGATATTSAEPAHGRIVVSFDDVDTPIVGLVPQPASSASRTTSWAGTSSTALGDGDVRLRVYEGPEVTPHARHNYVIQHRDGTTGDWTFTGLPSLPDGQYTAQASQVDRVGHVGYSTPTTFVIDAAGPGISLNAQPSLVGSSTPTFTGASDPGEQGDVTVDIYQGPEAGGSAVQSLVADRNAATGDYTATASPGLPDGQFTARARQSDGLGNVGHSAATTFVIDTVAPIVGLVGKPALMTSPTPSFDGTSGTTPRDGDVTVEVFAGATATGSPLRSLSTSRDALTGAYTAATLPALPDGQYTARARQIDLAGNAGHSAPTTFTVDSTGPALTLTAPDAGGRVNATPVARGVGGTAPGDHPDVAVTLSSAGGLTLSGTARRDETTGAYVLPFAVVLAEGAYDIVATQADAAGNITTTEKRSFTVDTTAPTPTLTASSGATPTFGGVAGRAAGDASAVTVTVYAGRDVTGTVVQTLSANRDALTGAYSAVLSPALAAGTYTAQARQGDDAGNVGLSAPVPLTVVAASKPPFPVARDLTAPEIRKVSLRKTRWRVGAAGPRLRYTLSEAATVELTVVSRRRPKTSVASAKVTGKAGLNTVKTPARIRRLKAGRYVMRLVATDAAGNRGRVKTVKFRIG